MPVFSFELKKGRKKSEKLRVKTSFLKSGRAPNFNQGLTSKRLPGFLFGLLRFNTFHSVCFFHAGKGVIHLLDTAQIFYLTMPWILSLSGTSNNDREKKTHSFDPKFESIIQVIVQLQKMLCLL